MFGVKYSSMGLVFVVDQMLLPMFHIGKLPYKISYFILVLWAFNQVTFSKIRTLELPKNKNFRQFAIAISGIIFCALLGELWLSFNNQILSYINTIRSILIYMLVILAFGLGQSASSINLKWLIWILFCAIILNFVFIITGPSMPSVIANFYYPEKAVTRLEDFGVANVQDLLAMTRPRGLFGNPNVSMLQINIIVVFIYLAIRNGFLDKPSSLSATGIILLPVILAITLASRSEIIVSLILAFANYRIMFRHKSENIRNKIVFLCSLVLIFIVLSGLLSNINENNIFKDGMDRILLLLKLLDKASSYDDTIARPFGQFEWAFDRFAFSPLFGSGFSSSDSYPFIENTQFFHNDWLYLMVTSGFIGLLIMLLVLVWLCLPLGLISLIPFVLPGMTNTFMLSIPSFIFYFFMIGLLREKMRDLRFKNLRITQDAF